MGAHGHEERREYLVMQSAETAGAGAAMACLFLEFEIEPAHAYYLSSTPPW